ncbi:MAG: polyphosphate polymerase domain-containing protein [Lachnospiraceae bacterium]|nr:polyphosphate polymerase domain-containing protein [Lachnospiraceae bacterium]
MDYRNELKYLVTAQQMALLQGRIDHLIRLDSHAGEQGMYNIRSLYFDDCYDSCLVENEIGTDPREKFRIRIYNHSPERITLELKKKQHMMTQKHSCRLTREQCGLLMQGIPLPVSDQYPPVLQKLLLLMRTRRMRPKVIVEYDRVPYVESLGNVRVTLDRNISSSGDLDRFLEEQIAKRPILPAGQHILEVKYDEFLPDHIRRNLQLHNLRQTAFSKYYLCRKYSLSGGVVSASGK